MGRIAFKQSCPYCRRENGKSLALSDMYPAYETHADDQHAGEFVEQVRWFMNLIINVDESREI